MLINWIKKKLGYHVCEEFTKWETYTVKYSRPPSDIMEAMTTQTTEINYTERYQERQCTICGKIQQRELEY